jgi:hypothetical protein
LARRSGAGTLGRFYLLIRVTPPVPLTGLPEAPRVGLPEAPRRAELGAGNWPTRGPAHGSTRGADSGYGGVTLGPKLAPIGLRRNRVASNACPIRLFPQLAHGKSTRQIPLYYQVNVCRCGDPYRAQSRLRRHSPCWIRRRQRRRGPLRDPAAPAREDWVENL